MKIGAEWQITNERFVCYLDILGFKDLVLKKLHTDIYENMFMISELNANINKYKILPPPYEKTAIRVISFSDSILLFSKSNSAACFKAFSSASNWLFYKILEMKIPIKGAIAFGDLSLNFDRQIYFGQPLIDSFLLQDELLYYGVIAHHSLEKYIHENLAEIKPDYYFNCKTQLKNGKSTQLNLDWFSRIDEKNGNQEKQFENIINELKLQSSGFHRNYIDNTKDIYNEFIKIKTS